MLATSAAQDLIKISENTKVAGVKPGTPSKTAAQVEQIRRYKAEGLSNYRISKIMSISASTVAKYLVG